MPRPPLLFTLWLWGMDGLPPVQTQHPSLPCWLLHGTLSGMMDGAHLPSLLSRHRGQRELRGQLFWSPNSKLGLFPRVPENDITLERRVINPSLQSWVSFLLHWFGFSFLPLFVPPMSFHANVSAAFLIQFRGRLFF